MIPLTAIRPSSRARAMAAGIALIGAVVTSKPLALVFLVAACVGILIIQGKISFYIRFLFRLWLPLAVGLCLVWGLIVRGNPQAGYGSGIANGFEFAGMVALRLAALAALFQATILSLEGLRLAAFLREVGLSPNATATLVSVFNLWPEFARRTDQVVAARCARGLMTDRRLWTRVRQFPWALRTLFVGSLGSSLDRAHRWEAERLPQRLAETVKKQSDSKTGFGVGLVWCFVAIMWTAISLWPK